MTETYYLMGFVACLWGLLFFMWRNRQIKTNTRLASQITDGAIKGLIENIERLEEENKALKLLTELPASESAKKVDWEPDDYKDLSDGTTGRIEKVFKENNFKDGSRAKHRRFDDDELSEVSHMLQDHELREYGG